jgi:hypothetical protein
MILEPAYSHLSGEESSDVLSVFPVPESHGVGRMIGQIRMKLQPRELEIEGDKVTLLEGLHYQGQAALIVISSYIHF